MDLLAVLRRYGMEEFAFLKEENEQFMADQDLICSRHFEGPLFQGNEFQFDSTTLMISSIEQLSKVYCKFLILVSIFSIKVINCCRNISHLRERSVRDVVKLSVGANLPN